MASSCPVCQYKRLRLSTCSRLWKFYNELRVCGSQVPVFLVPSWYIGRCATLVSWRTSCYCDEDLGCTVVPVWLCWDWTVRPALRVQAPPPPTSAAPPSTFAYSLARWHISLPTSLNEISTNYIFDSENVNNTCVNIYLSAAIRCLYILFHIHQNQILRVKTNEKLLKNQLFIV